MTQLLKEIHSVEIHCGKYVADSAWLRKYGKQIRDAGGRYNDIRSTCADKRFVTIPLDTPGRRVLAQRVFESGCSPDRAATVIARGFSHSIIQRRDGSVAKLSDRTHCIVAHISHTGSSSDVPMLDQLEAHVEKGLQYLFTEDQAKPVYAGEVPSFPWGANRVYALEGDPALMEALEVRKVATLKKRIEAGEAEVVALKEKIITMRGQLLALEQSEAV